ncbi:MAG: pyridoxal-dependent decarboxylase, partial [Myxococcota bacterium]
MKDEPTEQKLHQETLDPDDWEQIRSIGHVMLDDMFDYIRDVRERPAWQSPSEAARQAMASPLPRSGRSIREVYDQFKRSILPFPTGNIHPRFWGWVMGNGTPVGMLAELLGGAMNCHVSGYDQGATLVEHQVLRWLTELMDFPAGSTGLLVSGGTVANLIGVAVARNHVLGDEVRAEGVGRSDVVLYCSEQTHGWIDRTAELLGLGRTAIHKIPVDTDHRLQLDVLKARIARDRSAGRQPLCVIGNAGTVACGATDDLEAIANLAAQENLWFHVDGAFGAMAKLSPQHRHIVDGLERADSVAFDLHKWGYMQYELGVVLFRDAKAHDAAFSFNPSYLDSFRGGIALNPTEFASKGIQLSRGFRALKAWMQLSTYGTDTIGNIIGQNIEQVAYLRRLID